MTAFPVSRVCVTTFQRRRRATGSMPVDGSSRKIIAGFPIIAMALLTLRLFPPLGGQGRRKKMKLNITMI